MWRSRPLLSALLIVSLLARFVVLHRIHRVHRQALDRNRREPAREAVASVATTDTY
jgi:hypothetical protein